MGLLEKAMDYKNKLNGKGRTTIMDSIQGPAEPKPGGQVHESHAAEEDVLYLEGNDLVEVGSQDHENSADSDAGGFDDDVAVERALPALENEQAAGSGLRFNAIDQDVDGGSPQSADMDVLKKSVPPDPSRVSSEIEGGIMDYTVLFEFARELAASNTHEDLFETMLFFVMGQIGVSSSSIIIPSRENEQTWQLIENMGVKLESEDLSFDAGTGILNLVIEEKRIIDIEEHKNNPDMKDDYFIFVSIDARLLVPLVCDDVVYGVMVLGNKLAGGDYDREEMDYLATVADFSASVYRIMVQKLKLTREMEPLRENMDAVISIEEMRAQLMASEDTREFRARLNEYLQKLSISRYCYFTLSRDSNRFEPIASDDEDMLMIMDSGLSIRTESSLVSALSDLHGPVTYDDFRTSSLFTDTFDEKRLSRISYMQICPVSVRNSLLGFLMIYGIGEEFQDERFKSAIARLTSGLMPLVTFRRMIDNTRDRYIDTLESSFSRISLGMKHAASMGIPLTLVLFSIKNFKRFHTLMGDEKTVDMMKTMEEVLTGKLSGTEFSVRVGRQKVLAVLPGKDKKYAVAFAGAVCNDMNRSYSSREIQLLVTYLAAEYPIDGGGVHQLLNVLEL